MSTLLKTYSISKGTDGTFTLKFETPKDVIVVFDNDLKTIALSSGKNSQTHYSQNYTSSGGQLALKFMQNFGEGQPILEEPDLTIKDDDSGL